LLLQVSDFRFYRGVEKNSLFSRFFVQKRLFQNLIWAHFRLRRKPGFPGVPPRPMATCGGPAPPEANPQRL
jgi:hypothetical protein